MDQLDFIEVLVGSKLLREYDPDFDSRDEAGREKDRKEVAELMMSKERFIMDGHYAFGDETAFTEEEGRMYEIYIYLYVDPKVLESRMSQSDKNRKYLKYDIKEWQEREIKGLRDYCHKNNKDFYVVDNPPTLLLFMHKKRVSVRHMNTIGDQEMLKFHITSMHDRRSLSMYS